MARWFILGSIQHWIKPEFRQVMMPTVRDAYFNRNGWTLYVYDKHDLIAAIDCRDIFKSELTKLEVVPGVTEYTSLRLINNVVGRITRRINAEIGRAPINRSKKLRTLSEYNR